MSTEKRGDLEARRLIEALREGAVPARHLGRLSVGRARWMEYVRDDLRHYIAEGGAKVRFVNGSYGDGKTHFLALVQGEALGEGFAVAFVVLTREVSLQKFEAVYQEIVRNVRVPERSPGLRAALEGWMGARLLDWRADAAKWPEIVAALRDELLALDGLEPSFAEAIAALVRLQLQPLGPSELEEARQEQRDLLWRWLAGERLSKRDLKPYGIHEVVSKANSRRLLASLVVLLRWLGCKGLVLLCDELEIVLGQSASARAAAFENVRLLIDNADQGSHLYIFFSIIPDVLVSDKGFRSYDALWSRVRTLGDDPRINYRGVLIDLHRSPLSSDELSELGRRIRELHGAAHGWDSAASMDDATIARICEQQERMGLLGEVRLFIRQIIRALDVAEQGQGELGSPESITDNLLAARRELAHERIDERGRPSWDR